MAAYVTPMLRRIKGFFLGDGAEGESHPWDETAFAAAALMIEAGSLDGRLESAERERIAALVGRRFGLGRADADALVAAAERRMADTQQLIPFTRTIKDRLSEDEKIAVIEMLWEVIYADGRAHDHEANLMRRLGGLIYVRDVDIGAARKRVLARLSADSDEETERPAGAAGDAKAEDGFG